MAVPPHACIKGYPRSSADSLAEYGHRVRSLKGPSFWPVQCVLAWLLPAGLHIFQFSAFGPGGRHMGTEVGILTSVAAQRVLLA